MLLEQGPGHHSGGVAQVHAHGAEQRQGLPAAAGPRLPELADMKAAKQEFLARFPEYGYGGRIDELFAKEVQPRLGDEHYLDFTGSGLYLTSQIAAIQQDLCASAYGNPHSITPSSVRASHAVEAVRAALLQLFDADPAQYELVFTRSATGALQLIGEMFPWGPASQFACTRSNHKSVLGIREYAKAHGAAVVPLTEQEVEAWLASSAAQPTGSGAGNGTAAAGGTGGTPENGGSSPGPSFSLFAFPAYDNFSGAMCPAGWVQAVQAKSSPGHQWRVVWDTAAYAPCHPVSLRQVPADFICISFYKLFGFPTGVGALVMKKDLAKRMRKVYWGGGSANYAVSSLDFTLLSDGPERFEDGTLPFLDIISLQHGLRVFDMLGGVAAIQGHVDSLGRYLYEQASQLGHSNGAPLLEIYGNHARPDRAVRQGSTLTFSLLDPLGEYLSWQAAAQAMMAAGLHVRSGGLCNPGSLCDAVGMSEAEMMQLISQKLRAGVPPPWEWAVVQRPALGGGRRGRRLPMGVLRVSLGHMSRFEDVAALLAFLSETYTDASAASIQMSPEDEVPLQLPGASAFPAAAAHHLASC
ncbi:hypothetical protein ABPG75_012676 [Micractinium tetrahymenae]